MANDTAAVLVPQKGLVHVLALFTLNEGSTPDEVVNAILKPGEDYFKLPALIAYALFKAVDGSMVGVLSVFKEGADVQSMMKSDVVKPVWDLLGSLAKRESLTYDIDCHRVLEGASLEIKEGQVLTLALISSTDAEKQQQVVSIFDEHLSFAVGDMPGLTAGALLKSTDGTMNVASLGYWNDTEMMVTSHKEHEGGFLSLRQALAGVVSGAERQVVKVYYVRAANSSQVAPRNQSDNK